MLKSNSRFLISISIKTQARDPDLVKDILITQFDSFRLNDFKLSEKYDALLAPNPFFNVDDKWREGRKTIIPAFSQNKVWKTNVCFSIYFQLPIWNTGGP